MQFHDSEDHRRSRELRVLHTGPKLTRAEGRTIFREMVRAETRNGALSPLRRRRLIAYAAALQLKPVEAGKIVTEISHEAAKQYGHEIPVLYRAVETAAAPHRWPVWIKVSLTLVAAFVVNWLVRQVI